MDRFRKIVAVAVAAVLLLAAGAYAQKSKPASKAKPAAAPAAPATDPAAANLESTLNAMDRAAANFRTVEAEFAWDQYTRVVEETDTQNGKIYFRRNGREIQMAADIEKPEAKVVVYSDGEVRMYQPKIDTLTIYNAGKNKAEMDSYMVLGFGGRGHDLLPSYDVSFAGAEVVDGVKTNKLQLIPRSEKARNVFNKLILWIDPARGISIRQQMFTPSGDYRLAKYTNIKINQHISDDVYKLKTSSKTKVVTPQG